MVNVLITGAAGFMGSHLAETFLAGGHRVVGLDNFDPYYDREIKERNLTHLRNTESFELVEGDIRNADDVRETFEKAKPDYVLHWAAKAGVRPSLQQPAAYAAVNVEGTVNILEACRNFDVEKLIFASSSSVYGADTPLPFSETADIRHPISPYAATKVASEAVCYTYHHLYDLPVICLRLFTVFGPRQRPDLAINKFVRLMFFGEPLPLYGDGSSTRDYTYVEDVVRAVFQAIEADIAFEIINIGSGSPVTLADLVSLLETVSGVEAKVQHLPDQPGDVPHTYADITRARDLLDWEPQVGHEEGLKAFVEWFKNQPQFDS
ncbi:MAG: NAD-dependent epimerase/dehydratase family protein [Armatimonadota bacterium]